MSAVSLWLNGLKLAISCSLFVTIRRSAVRKQPQLHICCCTECGQNLTDHVSINQDTDAAGRQFNCRMTDVTDQDPARVSCAITFGWKVVGVLHASMTTYAPLITDKTQRSRHRYTKSQICAWVLPSCVFCFGSKKAP